ncbi:MAG: sugar ABC transporter permease [Eubacteriales bacterium]|nr:sugar ABC transporter permease [Eubacteriales bacterium]
MKSKKRMLIPFVFLAPYLLVYLTFTLYPTAYSVVLSFMKFKGGNLTFIGLKNFQFLFSDPVFYKAIVNTFIILLIQVPIQTILAVVLADFLNKKTLHCKGIFRMVIFMPVLIDTVSYSIVFRLFFNTENGMINNLLESLGMIGPDWLNVGVLSKAVIIIAMTWRWTGYNTVIILGGLQNIPSELYEAAAIDGAGKWQQFWSITIPGIKPVLLFSIILSVTGTLQLFTEPYLLTYGGPINETLTIVQYLYKVGFKTFNFGAASAGSYVLAIMIGILTFLQLKVTKED